MAEPQDSRQFLSSLMSPQSLSKSHHQMLLIQFPLLQRYWLRRQVFSEWGGNETSIMLPAGARDFLSFYFPSSNNAVPWVGDTGMEGRRHLPASFFLDLVGAKKQVASSLKKWPPVRLGMLRVVRPQWPGAEKKKVKLHTGSVPHGEWDRYVYR